MRLMVVLLLSCLGMAQPSPGSPSYSPANQDSAASSQNSPHEASEQKQEQDQGKPGARVDKVGVANQSAAAVAASKLPPDAPVITIEGLCDQLTTTAAKSASSACKTIVTREQFERLVDSLDPHMKPTYRRALADAYPRMLLFSKKAREIGLDKDPRYSRMMKWASLQTLGNTLSLQMQEKAGDISDAEIEQYYQHNPAQFRQCDLQRILVPEHKQQPLADVANTSPADEAAMKAEAEKLQARAAAGGDFIALQQEAYAVAGLTSHPPNVNLGKRTFGRLPKEHEKVFDLQPGQVSELFSGPNGFYIYKVVSVQVAPLSQARAQIRQTLQSERLQASAESMFGSASAKTNDAYFGSPAPMAQGEPAPQPAPNTQIAHGQPGTAPSTQSAQSSSWDSAWEESSVRSYLLEKGSDAFVAPPETVVPSNAPVITIEGVCDNKSASPSKCPIIVTRADFEAMVDAMDPQASANDRRRMADQYADLLIRGEKGRQLGVENTDRYKRAMTFMAIDNQFKMYKNLILERSKQLTDADVGEFYHENPRLFEEIKALRIVLPQFKASPPQKGKPTPEQLAAGHAEMKKEAENIAARAALPGADFQVLENEGWKASGYDEEPPTVTEPPLLRWEISPRTRLPIFDLKVGEVSTLIDEPKNGFYVFKIIAKRQVPLEEGLAYIRKRYTGVRYEDAASRLEETIKFSIDEQFFGMETQESAPAEGSGKRPGTKGENVPGLDIKIPKKVNL